MQNGLSDKFYCLRASPGAGKNFLATLLNKSNNGIDPFLIHYSQDYNEYFNTSEMAADPNGPYTIPFWDNKWKFVNVKLRDKNDLNNSTMHEHEWTPEDSRRFKAYTESNGKIGINPKTFIENIIEGYYITTRTPEEYNFIAKLIFIKRWLGDRPNILFDEEYSNLSKSDLFIINRLSPCKPIRKTSNTENIINILKWIEFIKFLNKEIPSPYSYPFSNLNFNYFVEYKPYKIDMDSYLLYYELLKSTWLQSWLTKEFKYIKDEIKVLEEFKKINSNIIEISYKDLFLDQIETGTIFDKFKDEIAEYTKRNLQLIEGVENFFGDILN